MRTDPAVLLEELSGDQLKALWKTLLAQKPELTDWLVKVVTGLTTTNLSASSRRTPISIEPYRHQIKTVLRNMNYSRPYLSLIHI